MATRFDKGINFSGQKLIDFLRKKSPKKESDRNYIGLQRSLALSDLTDPNQALNNLLDGISNLETAERNQYGGVFNSSDWRVTSEIVKEGINSTFLSQLDFSSNLGDGVSITPRLRLNDQISLLNSFYGEGSFVGLHSGPDAQFYRSPLPENKGFIKFNFNDLSGSVSVVQLLGIDGSTVITPASLLNGKSQIVLDLDGYSNGDNSFTPLTGVEISLRLVSPSTWNVEQGLTKLISIKNTLTGITTFSDLKFKLSLPYTLLNPPIWFLQSPSNSQVPGGADDVDPSTSCRILSDQGSSVVPVINRGYWYTKSSMEDRWSNVEYSQIIDQIGDYRKAFIQDSNMQWLSSPSELESEKINWGIRWDGYLRLTPRNYIFQVQTNVLVKIDMAIGTNSSWVNVFDNSVDPALDLKDAYVSSQSFNTNNVSEQFKYYESETSWSAFVPVTIRMFYGQSDKAFPSVLPPSYPNLFIKTTESTSPKSFKYRKYEVALSGTDGSWTVSSAYIQDLIESLQSTSLSVTYSLIGTSAGAIFDSPVSIFMTTNGTTVLSASSLGLTAGSYILEIKPYTVFYDYQVNLTALWRSRIASPSIDHKNYSDMVDNSFTPDLNKASFDSRPEWWKITSGSPYNISLPPSKGNTPLDGFLTNKFKPVLKSDAQGVGLYGSGDGLTFSSRPNIICGEARYSPSDTLGSNYTSIRLTKNAFGEGGRLLIKSLPINNSLYDNPDLLGENDLGGSANHLTAGSTGLTSHIAQMFLRTPGSPSELYNKYFLIQNPTLASSSDDPTQVGLPAFSNPFWNSPVTVYVVSVADDLAFTQNVKSLVSPLSLSVERKTISGYDLMCFSSTQDSILVGGSEVSSFSSKYIKFYTESSIAFQYSRVDTGDSISISDCLKLTYSGNVLNTDNSEVPKPASDRVVPFGFDKPEFGKDLCYPPYNINNPFLKDVAIDDVSLYSTPTGNYDVFWGDSSKPGLDSKTLTLNQKIEFQSYDKTSVQSLSTPVTISSSFYTHKMPIELPLDPDIYDEDVTEFFGNSETVKDSFYLFVKLNG